MITTNTHIPRIPRQAIVNEIESVARARGRVPSRIRFWACWQSRLTGTRQ